MQQICRQCVHRCVNCGPPTRKCISAPKPTQLCRAAMPIILCSPYWPDSCVTPICTALSVNKAALTVPARIRTQVQRHSASTRTATRAWQKHWPTSMPRWTLCSTKITPTDWLKKPFWASSAAWTDPPRRPAPPNRTISTNCLAAPANHAWSSAAPCWPSRSPT